VSRLRPTPLAQAAEHRAQHGGDVRSAAPLPAVAAKPEALVRPPGAGLSLRERRVKAILLKELKRATGGAGLSYAEHQKLVKTLDVAFIDAELAKMRKQIRSYPYLPLAFYVPFTVYCMGALLGVFSSSSSELWLWTMLLIHGSSAVAVPLTLHRALRRKIFIYEALRELSDVDEADVTLDDTLKRADLLIDRIVERELAADARFAAARSN